MPVCREKLGIAFTSKLLAVNASSVIRQVPNLELNVKKVCMVLPVFNYCYQGKSKNNASLKITATD
jgi:hypothetical protein